MLSHRHLVFAIASKSLLKRRQIAAIPKCQIWLVPIALYTGQIDKRPHFLIPPRNILGTTVPSHVRRVERTRLFLLDQRKERSLLLWHGGYVRTTAVLVLIAASVHLKHGNDRGEFGIGCEFFLD